MRFIKLKPVTPGDKFNEKALLLEVLNGYAQRGITVGQMRLASALVDKIEAITEEGGVLALETDEYVFLKQRYDGTEFRVINKIITTLADNIDCASETDPRTQPKAAKEKTSH